METWLVYIDDKTHAQQQITPLLINGAPIHWVLIGCPPRLTRHAGKWLTQKAIQRWRSQWTQENLQPMRSREQVGMMQACPGLRPAALRTSQSLGH
jgi:hypothetical protein